MNNKVITSQGNVQFQFPDGKIVNVHPNHIYTVFNEDTVSFILVALPKSSGLALMTSKAEDLEINGTIYTFEELPSALAEEFAIAGAQARCEIVDELPETGYTNTIYLVPQPSPQTGFDEYVYILDQGWELIGDTSIEMENYVTKTVFSGYTADTAVVLDGLRTDVDAKTVTVSITQSAYDALPSSAKTDATKLYVISDALPIDLSVYAKVSALTAEESARIAADSALTNAITAEENRAKAAESGLSDTIVAEIARAEDAESGLSNAITAETSAREAADSAISGVVDTKLATSVFEAYSAATEADINAISGVVDTKLAINDFNTYSGEVATSLSSKADKANAVASAEYVSSSTTIDLKNISGEVISQVDASDFIIDGMVEDVRIENGYLVIDFNTASGVEDIEIPLTDIFNPENYYDKDDVDAIVSGKANSNDVYLKTETSGATEISTALASKLDASAYTVDSSVIENSVNPVQGGALYDELRIEGEPSETTLEWDNHDGGETTNYPNGVSTIKIEVVDGSEGDGNGYSFFDENYENLGQITVLYNDGDVTVDNYENVTYSISGNVVTVNYPTIAASVTVIGSAYNNIYTIKAIGESSVISVKDQVTANTASISGKANSSDVYLKSETSGATEIATALNAKLDATAYTPTDLSNYYQKSETSGKTEISTALSTKQDTLVSGTSIKTINNESILGSGNITIQGGGGEVSSAITSGDTNAVAGGAVYDAVVYSGSTYNTELTFDANGYAENWIVGQSAITIDVSGYTSSTSASYHFENSNGLDLGHADIHKVIGPWGSTWNNNANNCTITTDGDTATTAIITDIPSGTVKVRRTDESNPPKAIISGVTPEAWIKDALDDHRDNTTVHITAAERSTWNNKSNFSGSYNDLTDKPIPDSALTSYSTNAVQSKTLFDELRVSGSEQSSDVVLQFDENGYSTNFPSNCTTVKAEVTGTNNYTVINFISDGTGALVGRVDIQNYDSITVDNVSFADSSYEISGNTVIITYPSSKQIDGLYAYDSPYTIKATPSVVSYTPLKDVVAENTTALGGLKLVKLSQQEYDALAPNYDNNTLYVII